MVSSFDSLPSEIQQMVFGNLKEFRLELPQFILVCNDWKNRYQKVLYSHVYLFSLSQLQKFLHTLEQNIYLSGLVTELMLGFKNDPQNKKSNLTIAKLFARLSNLNSIRCTSGSYFGLLADALSANQLPFLCQVQPPVKDKQIYDYINCVRFLKDRLKNLVVSASMDLDENGGDFKCRKAVDRLIEELDQFKNLEKLDISQYTDKVIELIEKATQSQSLQQLKLRLNPYLRFTPGTISIIPQASNVSHLKLLANIFSDERLAQYIILKFPHLTNLEVHGVSGWGSDMDEQTFKSFFNYVSKIENVTVKSIPCKEKSTENSIGSFWEAVSKKRLLKAHFWYQPYNRPFNSPDKMEVVIEYGRCTNTFFYKTHESDIKFVNLVKNYGHCIDDLTVTGVGVRSSHPIEKVDITQYEALLLLPLKHCTNLKTLSIDGKGLKGLNISGYEIFKKQTFDLLNLSELPVDEEPVFQKLSQLFGQIEVLKIYQRHNKKSGFININLAETDIGTVFLRTTKPTVTFEHVILAKITIQQSCSYYMYDFQDSPGCELIKISKDEYHKECDKDKRLLISISCKSLGSFQFNNNGIIISLTLDKTKPILYHYKYY